MTTERHGSHNAFERDMPESPARDRAEAAIEELRQRGGIFVDAVRATRMPMVLTDPNLSGNPIVFANASFLDLSGYSMDEVLGQGPHFLDGAETDPRNAARFRQALERDEDMVIETVQYRKDGSRLLVSVFLSAFKDEDGRTLHQFLSYLDVTARETAEEQLAFERGAAEADREAQLRLMPGMQAMWETDAEGVVVTDSPSWRAYTGQTLEEWLGYGWLDAIHPDDRAYAERQWREAIAARALVNADFRLRAPDGDWRWTNVRAVPMLDANGKVGKWAGMNTDIDARKRAEAALRESEGRQAFLLRFSDALRAEPDADAVAGRAVRMLLEQLNLDRCYITYYRPTEDAADFPYQVGNDSVPPLPATVRLSDFPEVYEQMLDQTLVIEDHFERRGLSEAERANSKALGMQAMVASTMRRGERMPLSSMAAVSSRPRTWSRSEISLVEEAAERTLVAIERARAEAALQESEGRQKFLLELSDAIRPLTDPLRIAEAVTARLCERLQVNRVHYGEIEGYQLKVEQDSTREVPSIVGEHSLEPFGPDYLAAYKPGAVIRVDDVEQDERLTEGARAGLRERQVAAFADAVLFEMTGAVSLLAVQNATPRRWSDDEETLIREVAERARSAIKRVRTENALSSSEERFRRFGEASQDVIWIRAADTLQWRYLTPAFEEMYGLSREEALAGNNYRNWLDLIVPEDRAVATENIKRVRAGEHVAFEYRIRRPVDGAIRHLRNTDFPITDEKGEVKLIGGIGHDLTELRETELRMQALIEGIPQLVWRAGKPGHWTWASPQWTQFTGQSEADSRDWGWLEPVHPDDRQVAREAWAHAVERGRF